MRSAYIPHEPVQTVPVGLSRTKQSFRDESEINKIVARYQKTGIVDHVAKYGGSYGDLPGPEDFHAAMNLVTDASSMFEELPSSVRSRFANDPSAFLEFVGNEENHAEMVKMGLIRETPAPEPVTEAEPEVPVGDPSPETEPSV